MDKIRRIDFILNCRELMSGKKELELFFFIILLLVIICFIDKGIYIFGYVKEVK